MDPHQACIEEQERFRCMVANIGHELSRDNRASLIYTYNLKDLSAKDCSGVEILTKLEELGKVSSSNPTKLCEILKSVKREDLVNVVEEYLKQNKDINLRSQFDALFKQLMQFIVRVGEMKDDLQKEEDERRQKAVPLLGDCKQQAEQVLCTLKDARSAARVSDSALALPRLGSTTAEQAGSPTHGSPKGKKKPLVPPHRTRTGTQSAPTSPVPRKRRQSHPTKFLASTGTPPVSSRMNPQFAKELQSKLAQHRTPVQETGRSPVLVPVLAKPSQPEDEDYEELTAGSTGDSGFEDSKKHLKIPLPAEPKQHEYTALQYEGMNIPDEYENVTFKDTVR